VTLEPRLVELVPEVLLQLGELALGIEDWDRDGVSGDSVCPQVVATRGSERGGLRDRVASQQWYHTIDLPGGVVTPGWYDLRELARTLPFPDDMAGMRCLDVGTFEGFWALQMESRGATDVTGIDILDPLDWDWPYGSDDAVVAALEDRKRAGAGFDLVRSALDSAVQRVERSIYDLDPSVDGEFDFIYVGSLLLHLRDPVRALSAVRSVCRGRLLSVDAYDVPLTLLSPRAPLARLDAVGRPWWWKPNAAALTRMMSAAGFVAVEPPRRVFMPPGRQHPRPRSWSDVAGAVRSRDGRELLFAARFGSPHLATLAEPVGRS
jgi:tRNA (mo5U34)-methyltransferase